MKLNNDTRKALQELKANKERDRLEEQKLNGIKTVTVSVLREGLKIDRFDLRMAGLINRRTRAIRLMFSCESYGHIHLCEEMGIPSSASGWLRFDWRPLTGKISCQSSYDERGMEETLSPEEYQEILQYLKENVVIDDDHSFNRYREYVFDGTNWRVAKDACSKQGYASDWQHSINAGLKASGVDTSGLKPFDPLDDGEFDD
jgi:hypothetical protein